MSLIEYEKKTWLPKDEDGNIPANAPSINASNLNRIEDGIENCVNAINDLSNSHEELKKDIHNRFERELLWANKDTTKAMSEQTITMDLSEYARFMVLCKAYTNKDDYSEHYISCKDRNMRINTYLNGSYVFSRCIKFTDNTFTISGGYRDTNKSSNYNGYGIVVEIYGYKN